MLPLFPKQIEKLLRFLLLAPLVVIDESGLHDELVESLDELGATGVHLLLVFLGGILFCIWMDHLLRCDTGTECWRLVVAVFIEFFSVVFINGDELVSFLLFEIVIVSFGFDLICGRRFISTKAQTILQDTNSATKANGGEYDQKKTRCNDDASIGATVMTDSEDEAESNGSSDHACIPDEYQFLESEFPLD